jgi:hypothetical protein
MDLRTPLELEGQRSINELLDEPIGDRPIQLELPIPGRLRPTARRTGIATAGTNPGR